MTGVGAAVGGDRGRHTASLGGQEGYAALVGGDVAFVGGHVASERS